MLEVRADGRVLLDGRESGLAAVQGRRGTYVYTPGDWRTGRLSTQHKMPHVRYAFGASFPTSVSAPVDVFEHDIRTLLDQLGETPADPR